MNSGCSMSRRQFMESTALAAGGLLAGCASANPALAARNDQMIWAYLIHIDEYLSSK